jgi:hypothetical protein
MPQNLYGQVDVLNASENIGTRSHSSNAAVFLTCVDSSSAAPSM